MKPPLSLFVNAKNLTASDLSNTSGPELSASLLEWFCLWEGRSDILDEEVIGDAGLLIGASGFENIDRVVLDWITSHYSAVRLEIGADFLCGYWRTTKKVDLTVIAPFIDLLQQIEIESWTFASGVYALYRLACGNADLSDTMRTQLHDHLLMFRGIMIRHGIHKGVSQLLVGF